MKRKTTGWILWGVGLIFLLLLLPAGRADNLYSSVIRIHILANSDSPEDQAVKLTVRDELLSYSEQKLSGAADREAAKRLISAAIPDLERIADETLARAGRSERATVCLTEEYYPARHYESLSLPAGEYLSLQVRIGEGEGQNWWCIFFPPICLNTAAEPDDALMEAGMTEENVKTVTVREGEYRIRFKILDLIGSAKEKISALFS